MNKQRLKELLPIMQAWVEGKEIQFNILHNSKDWITYTPNSIDFNDPETQWRIKPQPREWWIVKYSDNSSHMFTSLSEAQKWANKCVGIIELINVKEEINE